MLGMTLEEFLQGCQKPIITELGTSQKGNRKIHVCEPWQPIHSDGSPNDPEYDRDFCHGIIVNPTGIIVYYEDDVNGGPLQLASHFKL